MTEPNPRDFKDHLDELTAVVETLRCAIGAMAPYVSNRNAMLGEYDTFTAHLHSLALGKDHSERFLQYLEEHVAKTRMFLAPIEPPENRAG